MKSSGCLSTGWRWRQKGIRPQNICTNYPSWKVLFLNLLFFHCYPFSCLRMTWWDDISVLAALLWVPLRDGNQWCHLQTESTRIPVKDPGNTPLTSPTMTFKPLVRPCSTLRGCHQQNSVSSSLWQRTPRGRDPRERGPVQPLWMVVCPSSTLLMMLLLPGWPTMGLNRIRKKKKKNGGMVLNRSLERRPLNWCACVWEAVMLTNCSCIDWICN